MTHGHEPGFEHIKLVFSLLPCIFPNMLSQAKLQNTPWIFALGTPKHFFLLSRYSFPTTISKRNFSVSSTWMKMTKFPADQRIACSLKAHQLRGHKEASLQNFRHHCAAGMGGGFRRNILNLENLKAPWVSWRLLSAVFLWTELLGLTAILLPYC